MIHTAGLRCGISGSVVWCGSVAHGVTVAVTLAVLHTSSTSVANKQGLPFVAQGAAWTLLGW